MTHAQTSSARPGVTLIEILVVLAIIGILIALTAAALQKTVESQNARTSETQVFKLQQALQQEYDAVVTKCAQDAAKEHIPSQIVVACDGNKARAKAVWTAFQLRLNFPDSFAEATFTPLTIIDAAGTPVYSIPRPAAFNDFNGLQPALGDESTFEPEEESGALLFVILSKRSQQGGGAMATSAEDLTQASRRKVSFGGREFETFADAFKRSVGFRRWEQTMTTLVTIPNFPRPAINNESRYDLRDRNTPTNPADPANPAKAIYEIQKSPWVDAAKAYPANANRDPLDPEGLMVTWTFTDPNDKRRIIRDGVYPLTNSAGQPTGGIVKTGLYFSGQNRMACVYSLGKTKEALPRPALPAVPKFTHDDDILGFRLRKAGEKGYKQ